MAAATAAAARSTNIATARALERVVQLLEGEVAIAQETDEGAGIDRAGTRGHHRPLERRQPHRRPDRSTPIDRGDRAAGAEVGDDKPQSPDRPFQQRRRATDRPLDREAVEAVPPYAPARPRIGDGIAPRGLGQGRVEGSVEAGYVSDVGESAPRGADGRERDRIVKRRERAESVDRGHRAIVEDHRRAKGLAAMDDPMPDTPDGRRLEAQPVEGALEGGFDVRLAIAAIGPRLGNRGSRRICPVLDETRLERARPGVEYQRHHPAMLGRASHRGL